MLMAFTTTSKGTVMTVLTRERVLLGALERIASHHNTDAFASGETR